MATSVKKLTRLPKQGQIAGVCAGIAEYFDVDVTLVRLIFIVLAIITGGGMIIAYIVMAIVIPADEAIGSDSPKQMSIKHNARVLNAELHESGRTDRMRNYLGAGLILFGTWLLFGLLFPGWFMLRWDYVWPIVLIVIGLVIATRKKE
jgi:phage shock protein PspC (stress-responsive transcriptional regulator)